MYVCVFSIMSLDPPTRGIWFLLANRNKFLVFQSQIYYFHQYSFLCLYLFCQKANNFLKSCSIQPMLNLWLFQSVLYIPIVCSKCSTCTQFVLLNSRKENPRFKWKTLDQEEKTMIVSFIIFTHNESYKRRQLYML